VTQNASDSKPRIQEPRKFFIIYKRDTALDLAEHVHDGLHERGVDVFLDTKDLKEGLSQTPEWRKQRDLAIENAQVFIFIVTHSASTSDEIKHELKTARAGSGKDIKAFIDTHIWNVDEELTIDLDGESVNIQSFQVRRFDTKEALLREVIDSASITRVIKPNQTAE